RATAAAAALMTLDATGDDRIELRLLSCSGAIEHALAVIDVIDVLGVEVHTWGIGAVDGGPVGILATGAVRSVSPNARLRLHDGELSMSGSATDVQRTLADAAARRSGFLDRLAQATRRPIDEVDAEWSRGTYLVAADAVTLGYADAVVGATPRLGPLTG
ncbi:MAG TPA: ATP-dependent Clp protease proteolytic subunit, partial [Acidimicrobiales bacterium]|nr:ATP-dependent Clp protease proteolytic subunit [Acidimicrobiales bacterium]